VIVRRASAGDLPSLVGLFESYLEFYSRPARPGAAGDFLSCRLERGDSRIWVASLSGALVGFAQVYDEFSSLRLRHRFSLNDLYVAESARGTGAGRALVTAVIEAAVADGADGVVLETQPSNSVARELYESLGFTLAGESGEFLTYELALARC
jgi:ribosomal protein S18 acetylase RimI-like enzyme